MILIRQNPIRTWFDYVRLQHPFPTNTPHQNPYGWFIGLVYFLVFAGSLLVFTYLLAFINPDLIAVDQTIFYELS